MFTDKHICTCTCASKIGITYWLLDFSARQYNICSDFTWLSRSIAIPELHFDVRRTSTFRKNGRPFTECTQSIGNRCRWRRQCHLQTHFLSNKIHTHIHKREEERLNLGSYSICFIPIIRSAVYNLQYANDANEYTYVANECKFIMRLIRFKCCKTQQPNIYRERAWTHFSMVSCFSTNLSKNLLWGN